MKKMKKALVSILEVFYCMKMPCMRRFNLCLVAFMMLGCMACSTLPCRSALTTGPNVKPGLVFQVGQFAIHWDKEQLKVAHANALDKVLWQTLPGAGFIAAGIGKEKIHEARGSFFIKDNLKQVLSKQTVTALAMQGDALIMTGTLGGGHDQSVCYRMTFTARGPNQLWFDITVDAPDYNRLFLTYGSDENEHFFGFGEQFSYFDMKGKRLPIFVMEQGIGRGEQPITFGANVTADSGGDWHTSYAGVPHYITSRLNSLFLENYEYSVFDMRRNDRVTIELFSSHMTGRIISGDTPAKLISEYTASAGRMRALPDWIISGAILGLQGGTARVKKIYDDLKTYDFPIAALWLQDWVGARTTTFGKQLWWNWTLDTERYPKRRESIESLEKDGVKVMTYINPFLVDVTERGALSSRNLFNEAKQNGYLILNREGTPYLIPNTSFSAGLIDLSNPAAWEWTKAIIKKEMIQQGAMGWMADFGEALPMDSVLHSGESTTTFHNRYPELWARLNREAINEMENGDQYVFFTRSGYRESPRYSTLFWEGDQLVSWDAHDGIKTAVTGLLSGGLSGFSLNHSDIGGYTTISSWLKNHHRSKELNRRWMELSSMNVIYRSHEGNIPDANDQMYSDKTSKEHFALCAKIYSAWGDYRKSLVAEAATTGLPVARHLFIHYPNDAAVYPITYQQFMVGADLMFAPVLDRGVDKVDVYLPQGQWVHVWSGKEFDATHKPLRVTLAAPLGQPCILYKKDSVAGTELVRKLKMFGIL